MLHFVWVEILPAAFFLVPVYLLLYKLRLKDVRKSALCFLFAFYLCAVYALTGLPNVTYIRFDFSANLVPLRGMLTGMRNTILNILLFTPLGVFLPLLEGRYRMVKRTVAAGFFLSLSIELLQIFTYRATDVNDLITNTVGTLAGFCIAGIGRKRIRASAKTTQRNSDVWIAFFTAFCGMFFLQPFLIMLV